MKFALATIALLFSVSSFAETVVLAPGESIRYGATKIMCESATPAPTGPVCRLAGPGRFENVPYKYLVAIDGTISSATDNLDRALETVAKYRTSGLCGSAPSGDCKLAGPGGFDNIPYSNRVSINGVIVYATDNHNTAIDTVGKFRQVGLCN